METSTSVLDRPVSSAFLESTPTPRPRAKDSAGKARKSTILITGATGANGTEILKIMTARNIPVRAMVHGLGRTDEVQRPNVKIVEGDFDRPETLCAALDGVDHAFLLTNSTDRAEAQQLAFVAAAKQAGVAHVVNLSQLHADEDSPVRYLRYHAVVEAALRASGMTYTFLRPNLYMQGLLGFRSTIKDQNTLFAAAGNAAVSVVDVRDIAEAAVAVLTEPGHGGKTYDLTGPQALTHSEMASGLSEALGRKITFVNVSPESMNKTLVNLGMPAWQADGLIEDYAHYRRGEAAAIAFGVEEATGKAARDFGDFAHDHAALFS